MKTLSSFRRGFTLIEILVVMAIIAVLAVAVLPAFSAVFNGTNITRAGQIVGDELRMARQEAMTKNREVQVRFYHVTNGATTGWVAMQVLRVEQTATGAQYVPIDKVALLPTGIIISDPDNTTLSPLLNADEQMDGTDKVAPFGTVSYRGFTFRANGSPENAVSDSDNFLTLQSTHATGSPPPNYYTLQVDPVTGKVIVFRP